jgi:hypothetical protein
MVPIRPAAAYGSLPSLAAVELCVTNGSIAAILLKTFVCRAAQKIAGPEGLRCISDVGGETQHRNARDQNFLTDLPAIHRAN